MALINFNSNVTNQSKTAVSFEPTTISDTSEKSNSTDKSIQQDIMSTNPTIITSISSQPKLPHKEIVPEPIKILYPIRGTVWCDLNNNGIKDSEDITLKDIEVELYTFDNLANPISTVFTDSHGCYEFNNIEPNYYLVRITPPISYKLLNKCENSHINSRTLFSDKIYNNKEDLNILIGLRKSFKILTIPHKILTNISSIIKILRFK